jgi:hypothetical protein
VYLEVCRVGLAQGCRGGASHTAIVLVEGRCMDSRSTVKDVRADVWASTASHGVMACH